MVFFIYYIAVMAFKSGFVNIIGKPNVGKSTLMNALVGDKLSIITAKAQTTRHRILGIVNTEEAQIIYSDTPGIIKPHYKLQESMMRFVKDAYEDADVLLLMVEPKMTLERIEDIIKPFENSKSHKILVINKIDKLPNEEALIKAVDYWNQAISVPVIVPISALNNHNLEVLYKEIIKHIPEHPPYYPTDAFTDKPERFFISEIIREKILLHYKEEIPYSVDVVIDAFKEEDNIIRISALIITNKKSHKPILIGRGGGKLKTVGTEARIDAEKFFGKKIFLELYVKVKENWRDNDMMLRHLGYN